MKRRLRDSSQADFRHRAATFNDSRGSTDEDSVCYGPCHESRVYVVQYTVNLILLCQVYTVQTPQPPPIATFTAEKNGRRKSAGKNYGAPNKPPNIDSRISAVNVFRRRILCIFCRPSIVWSALLVSAVASMVNEIKIRPNLHNYLCTQNLSQKPRASVQSQKL